MGASEPGVPLLTELIATGIVVPGTKAIFSLPENPGPLMKKANTSLYSLQTYSGYSSEAKTY